MITDTSQRWTEKRESRRPVGELFNAAAHDVGLLDHDTAEEFVRRHHYAGECSPPAHPIGLLDRGELVGVAVFGPTASTNAHNFVFGPQYTQKQCVTLGRFVLVDSVKTNAESWFMARCFELLRSRGVIGVESCADPEPRLGQDGGLVKPGHVGTIYQATNGQYIGKTNAASLPLLPDGTVLSNRAQGKLVRGERGEGRAVVQLVKFGATPPARGEDVQEWLRTWRPRLCKTMRHHGNHRYIWCLDRRHRRTILGSKPDLTYPKLNNL